jgi:hypothetical protein
MFCYVVRLFLLNSLNFEATAIKALRAYRGIGAFGSGGALSLTAGACTCCMRELLNAP